VDPAWFEEVLYPLQDEVLAVMAGVETGFYLTGGTALGRIHLRHRYSEDLDLFVNDDDRFQVWADRLLDAWRADGRFTLLVQRRDSRFVRALVERPAARLKIEFVNDVRGRVGVPARHAGFGLVDTPENILANKVTALLDREEAKDLADVWALCRRGGLVLRDALVGASS
jgi:predicted nucleotidyltransferase component of viral defense system